MSGLWQDSAHDTLSHRFIYIITEYYDRRALSERLTGRLASFPTQPLKKRVPQTQKAEPAKPLRTGGR